MNVAVALKTMSYRPLCTLRAFIYAGHIVCQGLCCIIKQQTTNNGDRCLLLAITYHAYQYNHSEALDMYE